MGTSVRPQALQRVLKGKDFSTRLRVETLPGAAFPDGAALFGGKAGNAQLQKGLQVRSGASGFLGVVGCTCTSYLMTTS